jgi:photosystem II stability/assembly factor-like uncharacterized protein
MRSLTALALFVMLTLAASPSWQAQTGASTERLRGVSVVNDRVAWASGNKGTVTRTIDGGATWTLIPVPGAETLDFRDIEAFDQNSAYILSIGAGDKSRIYKTTDGGKTWNAQFTNADPKAFYDAIAFWDVSTGLAMGDPVDGRFTVIRTTNGGKTWVPMPPENIPPALEGDGAFAASGTCLIVQGSRNAWFGTGGAARARVYRSTDQGLTWQVSDTPISPGSSSAGVFSIAFADALNGMVVGGDYRKEQESSDNIAITQDGGKTWTLEGVGRLRGFRSAVAFVPSSKGRSLVAVGPAGADWSTDGGRTWTGIGDPGFHALSIAPDGRSAWAVGENGRVGTLTGMR